VAGLAALVWPDLAAAAARLRAESDETPSFDELLVWLCEAVGLICLTWGAATTMLVAVDAVRGEDRSRAGCPEWLRRAALTACGVGVGIVLAAPAQATGTDALGHPGTPVLMGGLAYPDRAEGTLHPVRGSTTAPRAVAAARTSGPAEAGRHVVRPGDTLWDLGAASLPADASDADITRRWRRIHAENAAVIGADPDLIHPGTVLHLPQHGRKHP